MQICKCVSSSYICPKVKKKLYPIVTKSVSPLRHFYTFVRKVRVFQTFNLTLKYKLKYSFPFVYNKKKYLKLKQCKVKLNKQKEAHSTILLLNKGCFWQMSPVWRFFGWKFRCCIRQILSPNLFHLLGMSSTAYWEVLHH